MFTLKRLQSELKIDLKTAKLINNLLGGKIEITGNKLFPVTNKWINDCYNPPSKMELIMSTLNETLNLYGVESIECNKYINNYWQHCIAIYLNTGDTYCNTILYRTDKEKFYITSWGDFVENNQKLFKE